MNTESTSSIDRRAHLERDENSSQFSREPATQALRTGMESNTSTNTTKNHRARWAAIGAAVAVSLGAGGIGIANATNPSGASAFQPITPCRLADTRPAPDNIGPKASPLGAAETYTINGWASAGGTGDCDATDLPDGTTGLELNVTAVGPTANTNLRFWPEDAAMPLASNLNPSVGQPATPNSVSVSLSPTGQFNVFNFQGSVNVVIDVVGVYLDHDHDDRYYTKTEVDDALAPHPITDDGKIAYAWNNLESPALNTAVELTNGYLFNPSGEPITVTRTAVGRYTIGFTDLNMSFGHIQVTGYGNDSIDCKVRSWGNSSVNVLCYDYTGAGLADSAFTVLAVD